MTKTRAERIAGYDEEIKKIEARRRKLKQAQTNQDRKDRTRRLCQRAGLLEKMLPDTIPLTDEQFKSFLEKTVANDFGRRTLEKYTAQNPTAAAAPEVTGAAAQGNGTPAAKPPQRAQDSGTDEDKGNAGVSG